MATNTTTTSAVLYQATQKFNGANCASPLSLISYQFSTTCTQSAVPSAVPTGTNSTSAPIATVQPCLATAPFASQGICTSDYHANGVATFGTAAYAELVIHSSGDCNSKTNIVGVRQYSLNSLFEWGVDAANKVYSGVNIYDATNRKLLVGKCQDTGCTTVYSDVSDNFPTDGSCFKPVDLFNANSYVTVTVYNAAAAKPAAIPSPKFVRTSSAQQKSSLVAAAAAIAFGFLFF
ncbi:UNVERIFIED_CONTAM: hypothetical protein HDU68_010363 [Siphonaria sp. JEL0065]|nr:hypothetical protein HDU68_010363 [Siphonaria sp. JEL0065]